MAFNNYLVIVIGPFCYWSPSYEVGGHMAWEKASVVKGHHVYKAIWTPVTLRPAPSSLLHLHKPPSFVHLHQGIFLLAPLGGSLWVHLELSCSFLLLRSFGQLHGLKLCCDSIRQALTRRHSTRAAIWSISPALPSWPRRVLETWCLFMYNYATTQNVLEVRHLLEAGV